MKLQNRLYKIFFIAGLFALPILLLVPFVNVEASHSSVLSQDLYTILADYSQYLTNGTTPYKSRYSSQIAALVDERRKYYREFFERGLHSKLEKINSRFIFDDITLSKQGDIYNIGVVEIVTMHGEPLTIMEGEYPLLRAAQWALTQAGDPNVREGLESYVRTISDAFAESVLNGVEVVFIVTHDIDIKFTKEGHPQIVRDAFTDKSNDNPEGFDNVSWSKGSPVRHKPDLTQMPDYVIYNVPVEILGQLILEDYTSAYGGGITPQGTGFYYNRGAARNYINTYTSNPSTYCSGSSVRQDTSKYNPAYQAVWSQTGCNDCVDYVSQALKSGGFPIDGVWYPSINSYAWNVTDGLLSYLKNLGAVTQYSNYTSLQVGDLAFTSGLGHVVMVAGVNPHTYSGHTNDRLRYPWSSALTGYWHIKDYIP